MAVWKSENLEIGDPSQVQSNLEEDFSDANRIHLQFLIQLRWWAVLGQFVLVNVAHLWVSSQIPILPLFSILGLTALSNLVLLYLARKVDRIPSLLLASILTLDIILLSGLLYFSGGPHNPFNFLYLVHIALATMILPSKWVWSLIGISFALFGLLFQWHWRVPELEATGHHHDQTIDFHLYGMWVAFGVAASFIALFVQRLSKELRKRNHEIAKLRRIRARAEKVTALGTLAASAAHELATPLSTIYITSKDLLDEIEDSLENPDWTHDLQTIIDETERCKEALSEISHLSGQNMGERFDSHRIEMLIEDAFCHSPYLEHLDLSMDKNAINTFIYGPKRALILVLRSLAKNAIEASPNEKKILVQIKKTDAKCFIHIKDFGRGMSDETLQRLGEPYFSTKKSGENHGLGIFLSQSILHQIGGSLSIESEPEKGTCVTIEIPLHTPSRVNLDVVKESLSPTQEERSRKYVH